MSAKVLQDQDSRGPKALPVLLPCVRVRTLAPGVRGLCTCAGPRFRPGLHRPRAADTQGGEGPRGPLPLSGALATLAVGTGRYFDFHRRRQTSLLKPRSEAAGPPPARSSQPRPLPPDRERRGHGPWDLHPRGAGGRGRRLRPEEGAGSVAECQATGTGTPVRPAEDCGVSESKGGSAALRPRGVLLGHSPRLVPPAADTVGPSCTQGSRGSALLSGLLVGAPQRSAPLTTPETRPSPGFAEGAGAAPRTRGAPGRRATGEWDAKRFDCRGPHPGPHPGPYRSTEDENPGPHGTWWGVGTAP